ncbi:MAG: hypothetical protein ABI263_06705 [Gelidibacter sp.]
MATRELVVTENSKKPVSSNPEQLWMNSDCGLKTRHWEENKQAVIAMVAASKQLLKTVEVASY